MQMEMFNRLYKVVTIGWIVNRCSACPHTAFIPLRLSPNEGVILSPQSISFTCPIIYLSLPVVFYRCLSCFTGFGEMRYRARERGRQSGVFTVQLHSARRPRWESLLAFTLRCAHGDKHAAARTLERAEVILMEA